MARVTGGTGLPLSSGTQAGGNRRQPAAVSKAQPGLRRAQESKSDRLTGSLRSGPGLDSWSYGRRGPARVQYPHPRQPPQWLPGRRGQRTAGGLASGPSQS